jgi:hypothetical protein
VKSLWVLRLFQTVAKTFHCLTHVAHIRAIVFVGVDSGEKAEVHSAVGEVSPKKLVVLLSCVFQLIACL